MADNNDNIELFNPEEMQSPFENIEGLENS